MKRLIVCLLIPIVWLSVCTVAAAKPLTVKGMSFFEPGREALAREKALDDAKRAAIEQAVGTAITASTSVEDFQRVKDRIFSHASGYLKRFKIIDEKQTALGTYEVTIEAEVETADLVDDMDRFSQMLAWQKNPRISILTEKGMDSSVVPAATKSVNLLASRLKQNGFNVYRPTGDNTGRMGLLVGLMLEANSVDSEYQGVKLSLNEISLTTNIYRPGDNEILATASAVKSLPGANRLQALDKGARLCVDQVWESLKAKLIQLWEAELFGERELFVTLENVASHNRAIEIADALGNDLSGVTTVDLIGYGDQRAEYRLRYRGWPEYLANEIQMSYFKTAYFDSSLRKIEGNTMVFRLK